MELISDQIRDYLAHASEIRKMFEAGIELRRRYGDDNVYDFSLGNPDLPPPAGVKSALLRIAERAQNPFAVGYMPNGGYPELREKLASCLSAEQGAAIRPEHTLMTCGAAGGLNVFFRAVLTAGDEVLTPCPYFAEYGFYVANCGGRLKAVPSRQPSFDLDADGMAAAIGAKTRAIILNSPNNPSGAIYRRDDLRTLAAATSAAERRYGHPVYVVADEPYRFLNYDGEEIPSVFEFFEHSAVIGSFSKSLSLAGERVGYVAINPSMEDAGELMRGLILCTRILGFVNSPALGQQILLECLDEQVDPSVYRRRRDAMAEVLDAAGISYQMPRGAFYFFPQSPSPDEHEFIDALLEEHVLAVAGSSFGLPGFFRLSFCVDESVIRGAARGISAAVRRVLER